MQYSQSSVASPYPSSPPLYPVSSSPTGTSAVRTSLSVDDLGYLPGRSVFQLPPVPPLTVSLSHTGSPAMVSRGGSGVVVANHGRTLSSSVAQRVSISGAQSLQSMSSVGGEQRMVASTPTAVTD